MTTKLTTAAACRVARIDRDRFNEHVAAGRFRCAPATIPGRARLFDPHDMVALWLFRELMEDGIDATRAGRIACAVAAAARQHPDAPAISYVEACSDRHVGTAVPADRVPVSGKWPETIFGGSGADIRKVTTFNIAKVRALLADA